VTLVTLMVQGLSAVNKQLLQGTPENGGMTG